MNRSFLWIRHLVALRRLAATGAVFCSLNFAMGQEDPIPLVDVETNILAKRNDEFWKSASARRALESGLYEVAEAYARESLESADTLDPEVRAGLHLLQIDALLGRGLYGEAGAAIDGMESNGFRSDSISLRKAVLALVEENEEDASLQLESVRDSNLDSSERAWLALVHGWLDLESGDAISADIEFDSARGLAYQQSPALAGQIAFLAYRYQLNSEIAELSIEDLRQDYDSNRGSQTGFRYGQMLAVALHELGRTGEAIDVVNAAMQELPEVYSNFKDQFLLLKLLLSGVESNEGQVAARTLAIDGSDVSLQRIGLQHIFSVGLGDDGPVGQVLVDTLDEIISRTPVHPLAAEALYYRGVRNFQEGDYPRVEDDAERLLDEFPNSAYRKGVLTLLASSSWRRTLYRTAASYLSQVRSEFLEDQKGETLSILIADCYFRAGLRAGDAEDYANAAEAYSVALDGSLDRESSSEVFFKLVLSYLNAKEIDKAKAVLDDLDLVLKSSTPLMVWQAEWLLIKQMRGRREWKEAYDRIDSFELEGLNLSLQMRLFWLGSKLAFESGRYSDTKVWAERLALVLEEVGNSESVDAEFLSQVKSNVELTLAESLLAVGETQEGLDTLARVREEYAGSESAERSYIVEARYLSDQDTVVEALQLLNFLVDNYPKSKYAPLALYESALNAEKRGQGEYLTQAIERLQRIVNDYPESELVYFARLKQGDLLRKLNQFGQAEAVYESLENTHRDHPELYWVQISLADTLIAQASEDPSKFQGGISRLERLMDVPNVPMELRVEAGYKRGNAWKNQGDLLKAKAAYWDLYDLLVADELRMQNLKRSGRYWLSRAIFELAEIFEDEAELDKAIEFYEEIENLGLRGIDAARVRIEQLQRSVPVASAP